MPLWNRLRWNTWKTRFWMLLAAWATVHVLASFNPVRAVFAAPLMAHDGQAKGEIAYVMADGFAYYERLRTAADLYHMDRVPRIVILNEQDSAGYDFVRHRSVLRVERAVDYLTLQGVPEDRIATVAVNRSTRFGSLSEARAVFDQYPELGQLVVVTSAPHTRRSKLSFRRTFPTATNVQIYAATSLTHSAEISDPLWIEYVKLAVYFVVA